MKINNKIVHVADIDIERIVDSLLFNSAKNKNCEIVVDCFTTDSRVTLGIVLDTLEENCSLDVCSDNFEVKSIQSGTSKNCNSLTLSGFFKTEIREYFVDILIRYKQDERRSVVRLLSQSEYKELNREVD